MEIKTAEYTSLDNLEFDWAILSDEERYSRFRELSRREGEDLFLGLSSLEQAHLLQAMPPDLRRAYVRLLEPDDIADLIQETDNLDQRNEILALVEKVTHDQVVALLAYAEDVAGGLMNPRYARLRPDMAVGEAISYLQKQSREQAELIAYAYVLDAEQHLLGMVSFRDLCAAQPAGQKVQDVMETDLVRASDQTDQEALGRLFAEHNLMAVPVVDAENKMKGIVTIHDIVDVFEEEATEDIQKMGGSEVLGAPYLRVGLKGMLQKRAPWLTILFVSEMFTTTAMGYFENEIAKAVVLAVFVPLIISSGGNAGSQASTLIIRAMALEEVQLRDWYRVAGREVIAGLLLGLILGTVGLMRVILWQYWFNSYGPHAFLIALTIFTSLIGIVAWGTLTGAILPFILRACKLDPATASTPFVATLVDVTGLVIYFTTASVILRGTLL